MPVEMLDLLTFIEAAEYLKTSKQQVRKMIASGELEAVKVGREYRVPLDALLRGWTVIETEAYLEAGC